MVSKPYFLLGTICAFCLLILPACGIRDDVLIPSKTSGVVTFDRSGMMNEKPATVSDGIHPNPFFYEVYVDGKKTDGVIVRHPATILFYGRDLNGEMDTAKLVDDEEMASCALGAPAGGVPLAKKLTVPEGGNTASWEIKITKAGLYAVCYYNANENQWIEVMARNGRPIPDEKDNNNDDNNEDDQHHDGEGDDSTVTTGSPSDPACPHLPKNETLVPYEAIKATSSQNDLLNLTMTTEAVAKVLCLHPNDIATLRVSSEDKKQYWYFSIICSGCGYAERTNYLVKKGLSDHADVFKAVGITSIEGLSKMPLDVHKDVVIDRSIYMVFLASLFFLAGGGLFIFGVMKYKERQEYFEGVDHRFGLVDGDIEDLFPPEDMGYAMRTDDDVTRQSVDAFIEVEE